MFSKQLIEGVVICVPCIAKLTFLWQGGRDRQYCWAHPSLTSSPPGASDLGFHRQILESQLKGKVGAGKWLDWRRKGGKSTETWAFLPEATPAQEPVFCLLRALEVPGMWTSLPEMGEEPQANERKSRASPGNSVYTTLGRDWRHPALLAPLFSQSSSCRGSRRVAQWNEWPLALEWDRLGN